MGFQLSQEEPSPWRVFRRKAASRPRRLAVRTARGARPSPRASVREETPNGFGLREKASASAPAFGGQLLTPWRFGDGTVADLTAPLRRSSRGSPGERNPQCKALAPLRKGGARRGSSRGACPRDCGCEGSLCESTPSGAAHGGAGKARFFKKALPAALSGPIPRFFGSEERRSPGAKTRSPRRQGHPSRGLEHPSYGHAVDTLRSIDSAELTTLLGVPMPRGHGPVAP